MSTASRTVEADNHSGGRSVPLTDDSCSGMVRRNRLNGAGRERRVGDLFPAIVGLVGVVVGALASGVTTSRRAEIADAHAERRDAYVAGLAALDSLTPVCREMAAQFSPVTRGQLEVAVRDRYAGDPAVRAAAEAVIKTMESELERVGPDLRRLDLLAGTPVLTAVHSLLNPLRMLTHELKRWLAGSQEERTQLHAMASAFALYDPRQVTQAMRTDLGRPWLVQYHDNGQYRWWRVWRR